MRPRPRRVLGLAAAAMLAVGGLTAWAGSAGATATTISVPTHCARSPFDPTGGSERQAHVGVLAPDVVQPGQTFPVFVSVDYPTSPSATYSAARVVVSGADATPLASAGVGAVVGTPGAASVSGIVTLTATGPVGGTISVALLDYLQFTVIGGSGAGEICSPADPLVLAHIGIGGPAPVTDPTVSVGDASTGEGTAGPAHVLRIPVTLSSPSTTPVRVDATVTDGTAVGVRSGAPNPDYWARASATRRVTFTPDPDTGLTPTVAYVKVPIIGDGTVESDETLTVTLSNPRGGYPVLRGTGTGTILDDDNYGTNPFVTVGDVHVVEGRSGARRIAVPVTLTRPVERTVTALVDINGRTATCPVFVGPVPPGADCRGRTALPVVFAPGQTDATVGVRIYADTNAELDELLEVTVNAVQTDGPTTAPVSRVHTQGIVTLQTDD